ncbi:MAG: hypothetical protein U9Q04_00055 [Campylobacterota bacterium]|nr:hypothetical protein [Campylobacterota bacterium]
MSLKENVEYVKKEISTEESFLENFFKLENFYKKYKKVILGSVTIIVLAIVGISVSDYIANQNKLEANKAFNTILENPDDKKALETLKSKNKKLYDIALYMNNKSNASEIEFFKELSQYAKAMQNNNSKEIESTIQNQKFILKEFAIFNKALIEAKNGQYNEAKETLKLISTTSSVEPLAKMLQHFLMTK